MALKLPEAPLRKLPSKNASDRDARELGRLGYAQELFRTMGEFSNFAISWEPAATCPAAASLP